MANARIQPPERLDECDVLKAIDMRQSADAVVDGSAACQARAEVLMVPWPGIVRNGIDLRFQQRGEPVIVRIRADEAACRCGKVIVLGAGERDRPANGVSARANRLKIVGHPITSYLRVAVG